MDDRGWLTLRRPAPNALLRLVAVPGAGSGAGFFRGWDRHLPDWVEFRAVSAPGREQRIAEPAPGSLEEHVDSILSALTELRPLPLALLGHSMGAIVAWELARRLQPDAQFRPVGLFLSAMLPPGVPRPWDALSTLPDDRLLEELRGRFAGFPPELDAYPELRSLMLATVRRDLRALESHRPEPGDPLLTPVHVLAGRHDLASPPESMAGWALETDGGFSGSEFDGGHDYIAERPGEVASTVVRVLRRVLSTPGPV